MSRVAHSPFHIIIHIDSRTPAPKSKIYNHMKSTSDLDSMRLSFSPNRPQTVDPFIVSACLLVFWVLLYHHFIVLAALRPNTAEQPSYRLLALSYPNPLAMLLVFFRSSQFCRIVRPWCTRETSCTGIRHIFLVPRESVSIVKGFSSTPWWQRLGILVRFVFWVPKLSQAAFAWQPQVKCDSARLSLVLSFSGLREGSKCVLFCLSHISVLYPSRFWNTLKLIKLRTTYYFINYSQPLHTFTRIHDCKLMPRIWIDM